MNGEPRIFTAAYEYFIRGWHVFPVDVDKTPLTRHGFHDASADPDGVRALWKAAPDVRGVAIRTGTESGLIVLDIDIDHGGEDSLAALEAQHGKLPPTPEVRTGGGGRHLYFRHPGGPVRNSVGKLGAGIDLRGDGGYVVAPPSPHESSGSYQWIRSPSEIDLADPPAWIFETSAPLAKSEVSAGEGEQIVEGQRNSALASFAGELRHIGLDRSEIEAALLVRNSERCNPPLDEAEVARIAQSISSYEPGEAERAGIGRVLRVQTAKEILEIPDPPSDDNLLGPLVVRGARTVIGAHTGEGKTTMALQMAWAVTTRSQFLDWTGAGGRVLVIDAEQGLRTVKRRLREARLTESTQVEYLRVPDGLSLDTRDADVAQLEAILADGHYDLVLADPLYKLHRGDSNEERHAVDLMRRLDKWRDRFGFGLILLVHRRKVQPGGGGFKMDDLFGSSAYLRGAEVVLGLRRLDSGYAHLHIFKDRDGDLPVGEKWGLIFDREEGYSRDPEDGKERETAVNKVRAALEAEREWLSLQQLADRTDYTDKTVRKALKTLGAIDRPGPGSTKRWSLPDGDEDPAS